MAFIALHPIGASSFIDRLYVLIFFPQWAFNMLVMMLFGVSSIILDIMSVDALRPIMIGGNGAPDGLIRVQIEL